MNSQNKYANGKIYKIISLDYPDKFYIGSTTKTLDQRWVMHQSDAKRPQKNRCFVYQTLNEMGIDKFAIELVEDYPCDSKSELHQRESYWIKSLQPALNSRNSWVSEEEKKSKGREKAARYRVKNRDKMKVYYTENKEKIKEINAQYRANNKNIIRQKKAEYRANNQEKLQVQNAKYRNDNKDKIRIKTLKKSACHICGRTVRFDGMRRHQRTKRCQLDAYVEIEFIDSDNEVEIEFIG